MQTTKTKKLILPVTNPNDFFDGFDHGVVELSQSDIDRIRNLSEAVKTAKQSYDGVYQLSCLDLAVTTMKADYDSSLEDGKLPLVEPEYPRIECCTLVVSDQDFHWMFYPKFCDTRSTTASVLISELETFETLDAREVQK